MGLSVASDQACPGYRKHDRKILKRYIMDQPVSYTHLDVYKRQERFSSRSSMLVFVSPFFVDFSIM